MKKTQDETAIHSLYNYKKHINTTFRKSNRRVYLTYSVNTTIDENASLSSRRLDDEGFKHSVFIGCTSNIRVRFKAWWRIKLFGNLFQKVNNLFFGFMLYQ